MKKVKKLISLEAIAANFAVILSVCAIGVSIFEVNTNQEKKHAQVWPRVYSFTSTSSSDEIFSVNIDNRGVGPAIIKYIEVSVDNEYLNDWHSFIQQELAYKRGEYGF